MSALELKEPHESSKGLRENRNDREEKKGAPPKAEKSWLCPPRGVPNRMITGGLIFVMIWCMGWAIVGVGVMPRGNLFGLLMIFYCAFIGGKVTELIHLPSIPRLPPLLGMLLAGFTIRNIPAISSLIYVDRVWSSTLRNIALTVILVRAGLGLDPEALKTMKGVCLRLSVAPCMMEALSAAIFSHLLMKFPWDWALLLGFVVGAVSPAVVVPSMLYLQEQGYGVDKGIPTLLVAASSLDDIVAITGFNTCISIIFSSGGVITNLLHSVRDIILGVLVGAALGLVLRYFPSDDQAALHIKRSFLVLSMCVWAVLGSQRAGFHAAGGLCTLVLTFIAGINWSKQKSNVQKVVAITWNVFQPLLFGLVGAEISVVSLKSNAIGISVATISLALLVRISFTFLLMSHAGFNCREKMFIALAWMPKATVQAVLGPLALETARIIAPHLESYSKDVMTVAFLAILISAPNGALIIGILGPRVLMRNLSRAGQLDIASLAHV